MLRSNSNQIEIEIHRRWLWLEKTIQDKLTLIIMSLWLGFVIHFHLNSYWTATMTVTVKLSFSFGTNGISLRMISSQTQKSQSRRVCEWNRVELEPATASTSAGSKKIHMKCDVKTSSTLAMVNAEASVKMFNLFVTIRSGVIVVVVDFQLWETIKTRCRCKLSGKNKSCERSQKNWDASRSQNLEYIRYLRPQTSDSIPHRIEQIDGKWNERRFLTLTFLGLANEK